MNRYSETARKILLRLPIEGCLDLTYRCNNNCLHCWLIEPNTSHHVDLELRTQEWLDIIDQARGMGTREWILSGGEPMLREDFLEIFGYILRRSYSCIVNTNGTLINEKTARALKGCRPLVALYGATPEVHDHITRHPGSFAATLEGMARLREAGVDSIIQIVPMKDNYHQKEEMIRLALSLGSKWRFGVSFIHSSVHKKRNKQILQQRLSPEQVVDVVDPQVQPEAGDRTAIRNSCGYWTDEDTVFRKCAENLNSYHIDPYGKLGFCSLIKEDRLRFDLRSGSFQEGWERFLPSLAHVRYRVENSPFTCRDCKIADSCEWCPAVAFLETGSYSKRINYLCQIAAVKKKVQNERQKSHRRLYGVAGMTLEVLSDLPITDSTFGPNIRRFETTRMGSDVVTMHHHYYLPEFPERQRGRLVLKTGNWRVYQKNGAWFYTQITADENGKETHNWISAMNKEMNRFHIFQDNAEIFKLGHLNSITRTASDQILLSQILARRQACIMHSAGLIYRGKGLMFVGHAEAGKSTVSKLFGKKAELLCDDRNIIRKWPNGFRLYGTWSHGELPHVSPGEAPLSGIYFLEKSSSNSVTVVTDKKWIIRKLLACLIKSFRQPEWWQNTLTLLEQVTLAVPCYRLQFDKSGRIVEEIDKQLLQKAEAA
ncbi:radical SAM protein [bacterium]|nr:radical SAM protein [bacterium]